MTGLSPLDYLAARGGRSPSGGFDPDNYPGLGVGAAGRFGYDAGKSMDSYKDGLRRMGVREDLITTVITQAAMHHVNPLLMGAVMMQESAGGSNKKVLPGGSMAGNVMQIVPGPLKYALPMDQNESIAKGAAHLERDLAATGGNIHDTLQKYAGPKMDTMYPDYVDNVSRNLIKGGFTGNIPTDQNQMVSSVRQAEMTGSAASLAEMNIIVPNVNKGLEHLAVAAERVAKAMDRMGAGRIKGDGSFSDSYGLTPN